MATGDADFGAAFASTTSGTWTTQADRLQFGTTTSVALDGLFDNVRLDVGSMPPAGAAPGGLILARAPHTPRVVGDAPSALVRPLMSGPTANETWKVYYYAGSSLIAMRVLTGTTGNTLYYLHSDHLGSTSLTTDVNGAVVARQYYYPYGEVRAGDDLPTDIGFTGQRAESSELGSLMFFRARYYSSYLNRWIQPDSIVPEPGNPQALNRLAYVYNNPLKYTDPSGHCVDNDQQTTRDDPFDCSVEELSALDWDVRSWWIGELAKAGNAKDWFNNIRGILAFFNNTPELHNSSWASLSDAALLWVIQEGFREVKYGERAVTEGGIRWAEFFEAAEQRRPEDVLESVWGQAEQIGTMFGRTYAEGAVGFPGGLEGDVLNAFVGVGNDYRDYLATGTCNGCTFEPLYEHCDWCTSPKNSLAVYIGAELAARGAREVYYAEHGIPSPYPYRYR